MVCCQEPATVHKEGHRIKTGNKEDDSKPCVLVAAKQCQALVRRNLQPPLTEASWTLFPLSSYAPPSQIPYSVELSNAEVL